MHLLIETHRAEIALASCRGLENVRVFGLMARGDVGETNDVDLLVAVPLDRTGATSGALLTGVQELLNRRVDAAAAPALGPELRDRVPEEAQPQ